MKEFLRWFKKWWYADWTEEPASGEEAVKSLREWRLDQFESADGYFITHNRMTDVLYFGPFASLEEADAWNWEHPEVRGNVHAMHRTVDWNR